MKVLIIGSGGREHALVWACRRSKLNPQIACLPGNGGTESIARNVNLHAVNHRGLTAKAFNEVVDFIRKERFDLTVIGPDDPIAAGLADKIMQAGYPVFAPSAAAAQIEASKVFAKQLMFNAGISTADFRVFSDFNQAADYIHRKGVPIVVKASGLALGKGALVCRSIEDAHTAARAMLVDGKFGAAGSSIVIEEYLDGQEISLMAICDGKDYLLLPPSRDHKRAFDDNQGPNTGGMGVIAPLDDISDELIAQAADQVIQPVLKVLAEQGRSFKGCIYPGLMITKDGFKVLEINARFGDPEAQAVFPILSVDILEVMNEAANGNLGQWLKKRECISHRWNEVHNKNYAVTVIAASNGYPGEYKKGFEITGLPKELETIKIFHAGTKYLDGRLLTAGGRVLAVTGLGASLESAREHAYEAIRQVKFDGMFYRRDIGKIIN